MCSGTYEIELLVHTVWVGAGVDRQWKEKHGTLDVYWWLVIFVDFDFSKILF